MYSTKYNNVQIWSSLLAIICPHPWVTYYSSVCAVLQVGTNKTTKVENNKAIILHAQSCGTDLFLQPRLGEVSRTAGT